MNLFLYMKLVIILLKYIIKQGYVTHMEMSKKKENQNEKF